MKKLFYIATFLLPLFTIAQTQLRINADIRGRSCSGGLGLCSNTSVSESKTATTIAQKISDTQVAFIFDKASLSLQNQESIAGKVFAKITTNEKINFTQETDVFIDPKTLELLGFNTKYSIIKRGMYPMIIDTYKVLVLFTLSER